MTDIARLLQSAKNPATRRLLEAGLRDCAPAQTAAMLSATLGLDSLGSSAAAAGSGSVATTSAPGAASALVPAASAALPSALSVGKCLLLGVFAGSVGSAGFWAAERTTLSATRPDSQPAQSPEREQLARPTPAPARRDAKAPPPMHVEPAALRPLDARAPVANAGRATAVQRASVPAAERGRIVASAPAQPAISDSALDRETRLVDGARQALMERDSARASALLDSYDATRAVRVLDREALLLRVELSLLKGDRSGARALAERFAQLYPTDAHNVRLRALLSPDSAGAAPTR